MTATKLVILYSIIAHILDAVITAQGVFAYGLDIELNPIAKFFMANLGVQHGLLVLKLIGLPIAIWAWNTKNILHQWFLSVLLAVSGTIGYLSSLIF